MPNRPTPIDLPGSYAKLNYGTLRIHHVPESSPEPTPVVIVELYRPKKYNAFNEEMMLELEKIFTILDIDDRIKAIVVTGNGKMFCAGADLDSAFKGGEERPSEHRDGCRKPVIGAINGAAVGVGITMTLPMTVRIAYSQAKIGFIFARRAIVMEACSSFFLPRLIGHSRALHLACVGGIYPASHKLLQNLFSEVLDKQEDVLPRALEIADEIVKNNSTISVALMRDLMYRGPTSAEATHLLDSRVIYELFSSADNKEGVKAFFEKRLPKFTGTLENDAPAAYPWWDDVDTGNRVKAAEQKGKPKL